MSDMVELYCPGCTAYVGFISLDPEKDYLESGAESREPAVSYGHPAAALSRAWGAGGRDSKHP